MSGVEIYGGGFRDSHACAHREKTGADSFWRTLIGPHTLATLGCWPGVEAIFPNQTLLQKDVTESVRFCRDVDGLTPA